MANMSYCRFHNTLGDLMDDNDLSEGESEARARLIKLCAEIASWYVDEEDDAD